MSHNGSMWVIVEHSRRFWVVVHGKEKQEKINEVRYLPEHGHDISSPSTSIDEDHQTRRGGNVTFSDYSYAYHMQTNCQELDGSWLLDVSRPIVL